MNLPCKSGAALLVVMTAIHCFPINTNAVAGFLDIPDVHVTIIRLEYQTFQFRGYYELSQPYRKTILPERYTQAGNLFYTQVPAADFGYTRILNRLTGQMVVHASTVWAGVGGFEYPPDSLRQVSYTQGYTNPPPRSLFYQLLWESDPEQAANAWHQVESTSIIRDLSTRGAYEVVVFDHFYGIGIIGGVFAEWIIVVFTHPPAPLDAGFAELIWPKTLMTRNVNNFPEVVLHNFSDSTISLKASVAAYQGTTPIYTSQRMVNSLSVDSSSRVKFDPLRVHSLGPCNVSFSLLRQDGTMWVDAFPDNDTLQRGIGITTQPVFKPICSIRHPGRIPMNGVPLDFDGDGDTDVFEYGFVSRFWQRDADGVYHDITAQSNITLRPFPRSAIEDKLDSDNHPDIILTYFGGQPQFLAGDGAGVFIDKTPQSGLLTLTTYFDVAAFDIDNDGDKDLIFQSYAQESVMQNDGAGHFTNITSTSGIVDPNQTQSIGIGDLNSDGRMDVILANWNALPRVFINNGGGHFSMLNGPWSFLNAYMCMTLDYNSDNILDVLFARVGSAGPSILYKGLGNLTYVDASSEAGINFQSFSVSSADFNHDGNPDLLSDRLQALKLHINLGVQFVDSTGLLVDLDSHVLSGVGNSSKPTFVDLDEDGDLDIYSQVVAFENMGLDSTALIVPPPPSQIPNRFFLSQNYPNPFNPETRIGFRIQETGFVTLKVFDVLGREVATLVNEEMKPGRYERTFDSDGLASGLYLYRLISGNFVETKKMLIVR